MTENSTVRVTCCILVLVHRPHLALARDNPLCYTTLFRTYMYPLVFSKLEPFVYTCTYKHPIRNGVAHLLKLAKCAVPKSCQNHYIYTLGLAYPATIAVKSHNKSKNTTSHQFITSCSPHNYRENRKLATLLVTHSGTDSSAASFA